MGGEQECERLIGRQKGGGGGGDIWDSREEKKPDRSHLLYIIRAMQGLERDTVGLMGTHTSKRSRSSDEIHCFLLL